mgnify:CR=1 FL=1
MVTKQERNIKKLVTSAISEKLEKIAPIFSDGNLYEVETKQVDENEIQLKIKTDEGINYYLSLKITAPWS